MCCCKDSSFDEVDITPGRGGWSPALLSALQHALAARAARYPATLEHDRRQLVALELKADRCAIGQLKLATGGERYGDGGVATAGG